MVCYYTYSANLAFQYCVLNTNLIFQGQDEGFQPLAWQGKLQF